MNDDGRTTRCGCAPLGASLYASSASATGRSRPSLGSLTTAGPASPSARATSVAEPPESNASPSVAPKPRINAPNSGRVSPTDTAALRPSTTIKSSVPSGTSAAPATGKRTLLSSGAGLYGSLTAAPFATSSGPPPTAARNVSAAGVVSKASVTVSPAFGNGP